MSVKIDYKARVDGCTWVDFYFYVSRYKLWKNWLHQNLTLNTFKSYITCYRFGERYTAENVFKDSLPT